MVDPTIDNVFQTGIGHHQAGRWSDAESAYRQVLARQPRHFNALYLLGVLAHQAGNSAAAAELIQQAVALEPRHAEAQGKLGVILALLGRIDEAIDSFRRAIALNPEFAEAYNNLGALLAAREQFDEAISLYHRAVTLRPQYAEAYNNLGVALKSKGLFQDAIVAYQRAISLRPGQAELYSNLGAALTEVDKLDEAIAAFDLAIQANPAYAEAHCNLGKTLNDAGKFEPGAAASRHAMALRPEFAAAHWNYSLSLLSLGELAEGFREFEWRFKYKFNSFVVAHLPQPRWLGEDPAGKRIVVRAEQGLGDMVQFARYVPQIAARGARVILESPVALHRLFKSLAGVEQIVPVGQPLPAFDLHVAAMTLPMVFGTDQQTVPTVVPYLRADSTDVAEWRGAFAKYRDKLKVGLVWAGNPKHSNDRHRSVHLKDLLPLARVPGVQFFSVQKGLAAAEMAGVADRWPMIDYTNRASDFADTAALLSHLDLVITVDTSVAHVAGAMGKPVWVMLPCVAEWRWMTRREDSPWYPTMRLFRQSARGDWAGVARQVAAALSEFKPTRG